MMTRKRLLIFLAWSVLPLVLIIVGLIDSFSDIPNDTITMPVLSQRTSLTFPREAILMDGAEYHALGTYYLYAVVRVRRTEVRSFLSQPHLAAYPRLQIAAARAAMLSSPKLYGFQSQEWTVGAARNYQMRFFNEPDLGRVLLDLDNPNSVKIFILYG